MNSRNQSLDVLRSIAILLVLGHHFAHYVLYLPWWMVGWTGVDLFFVLSGFLISRILFREFLRTGTISYSRFLIRRAFKIVPPMCAALVVLGPLALHYDPRASKVVWSSFLFFRNYLPSNADQSYFLVHMWSLGVEEHFYLFTPLLLLLFIRARRGKTDPFRGLISVFGFIAGACLLIRIASGTIEAHATQMRIDSLFAGVALGYLRDFRPIVFKKLSASWWALPLAALLWSPALLLVPTSRFMQTLGITLLLCAFSLILCWCFARDQHPAWNAWPFRLLGKIGVYSYSIYLWHTLFLRFDIFWFSIAGAIIVGIAMSKLIEIPALRLRDRLSLRLSVRQPPASARNFVTA